MPYSKPFTRDDTIARLATITDVIAEDLADESTDRQMTLENVARYLTTLTRRLKLDAEQNADDAVTIATGIELLLNLVPEPASDVDDAVCKTCGGCTKGRECIGEYLLGPTHGCKCN
ncbi:MAG TPA: hypothetical protein VGH54_15645 [Mycobacterium sp.]|jgi:hypothetical protein|uniref:hypothetical protein n=1 Tax=Mycobacterium sp. TaxID=1785 RepID=UPI002F42D732